MNTSDKNERPNQSKDTRSVYFRITDARGKPAEIRMKNLIRDVLSGLEIDNSQLITQYNGREFTIEVQLAVIAQNVNTIPPFRHFHNHFSGDFVVISTPKANQIPRDIAQDMLSKSEYLNDLENLVKDANKALRELVGKNTELCLDSDQKVWKRLQIKPSSEITTPTDTSEQQTVNILDYAPRLIDLRKGECTLEVNGAARKRNNHNQRTQFQIIFSENLKKNIADNIRTYPEELRLKETDKAGNYRCSSAGEKQLVMAFHELFGRLL